MEITVTYSEHLAEIDDARPGAAEIRVSFSSPCPG